MSRSKSFLGNTFWSLMLQVTSIIVAFLVPRSIIACYGSSVNGLVTSLTEFVSYINLVEAGISAAAVFALYKPMAEKNTGTISTIVSAAKNFYYKSGWVFVALIAVLAFAYPLFVDCGDIGKLQVFLLVVSLGSMGVVDFFTLAKYRVLLTASQRNWVIQVATIIYKLLYAAVVVFLANIGVSVEIVYVAAILPVIVRCVILSHYTKRKFTEIDFSADYGTYKLSQRWDAFYLQILGVIQNGAPLIVATFVLQDLAMVSVFSVYLLVANGVQSICSSLSNGTQASFGDVIAKGQLEILQKSFREFQTMAYALNALLCGAAIVLVNPFVGLYTADVAEFDYVHAEVGMLVMLNVFLYHLKTPQGLLVISAGMYKETRVQTSIQALILLAGSIAGGLMFELPGILVACCLSNLYRDIDLMFFIPKHVTKTEPIDTGRRMLLSAVEFVAISAPFFVADDLIVCASWIDWLAWALIVAAWGVVVCCVLCWLFERSEFNGLRLRISRIVRRVA